MNAVIASSMTTLLAAEAAWLTEDQLVTPARRLLDSATWTFRFIELIAIRTGRPPVLLSEVDGSEVDGSEVDGEVLTGDGQDAFLEGAHELLTSSVPLITVDSSKLRRVGEVQRDDTVVNALDPAVKHRQPRGSGHGLQMVKDFDPTRLEQGSIRHAPTVVRLAGRAQRPAYPRLGLCL